MVRGRMGILIRSAVGCSLALPLLAGGCGASSNQMSFNGGSAAPAGRSFAAASTPSPITPATRPAESNGTLVASTAINASESARTDDRYFQQVRSQQPLGDRPCLTKEQVTAWAQQGTRDDIIIDCIERGHTIFRLSAADDEHLRQQGVSEDVICAMKETARR